MDNSVSKSIMDEYWEATEFCVISGYSLYRVFRDYDPNKMSIRGWISLNKRFYLRHNKLAENIQELMDDWMLK